MLQAGPYSARDGGEPSLSSIAEAYLDDLAERARPKTIKDARRVLARFVRDLGDGRIDVPRVRAWRSERIREGASHKTINTECVYLNAAFRFAVDGGILQDHPLLGLRALPKGARHQRRRPRALTDDEARALLRAAAAADKPQHFPRAPFVAALVLTGCRYGELATAVWSDFDAARATLTLRAEATKTETSRTIPVDHELARTIEGLRWHHARKTGKPPGPSTRIFLTQRGLPWSTFSASFHRQLRALYLSAGIAHEDALGRVVHTHALRHSFCTRLARSGVPIATAQVLTGHKSVSTLLGIYVHLSSEEGRNAIEGLPRLT